MRKEPIYVIEKVFGKEAHFLIVRELEGRSAWCYCVPCGSTVTPALKEYTKESFSKWFDQHIELFSGAHGAHSGYSSSKSQRRTPP